MSLPYDAKVAQLCTWLDSYLAISRAVLNRPPTQNTILYFLTAPPTMMRFHCTTANYKNVEMQPGDFYYNGPGTKNSQAMLYCLLNGSLVPVLKFTDFFAATLISVNPEYDVSGAVHVKAREVVSIEYVPKHGAELSGPLLMPSGYVPSGQTELVTKDYVDTLRRELEARMGQIEQGRR